MCALPISENHNPQLHAHELEFLQAVALSRPRSRNAGAFAMTQALDRILPLVRQHTLAVQKMAHLRLSVDPAKNKVEAVLDRIRATTYTVRGPRHAYQTRAYLRDFAAALDARFVAAMGWSATELIDCLEGFAFRSEKHTSEIQSLMSTSYAVFCLRKNK